MRALAIVAALAQVAGAQPRGAVRVGPGSYHTPFPATADERALRVPAFWLDREPVTNADFLAFVGAHPAWRRDRVPPLYAERGYLAHWQAPNRLGAHARPHAPVVNVSWFAARAYCKARGGRLPSEAEWELAATPSDTRDDPAWYDAPASAVVRDIGGPANAWGVADLHALVWEWVEDFGGTLLAPEPGQACGGGTIGAIAPRAYGTFARYSFRSSLDARDAIGSLGFRCAYDAVNR
jgi:formylglycine-generating enzyme required for sulfatase activity